MFLRGLRRSLDQFLIATAFALPERIHGSRISGVLINRSFRRDDLPATNRARPSACGSLLDVDIRQLALVVHFIVRTRSGPCTQPDLRRRKAKTKIAQNIATGGTSSTSTPIFRLRAKRLFCPIEARHITHWAIAERDDKANTALTANAINTERVNDFCVSFTPNILVLLSRRCSRRRRAELPGTKTVWEKDHQQADADDQRRYYGQDQGQSFESQVHEVRHD